MCSKTKTTAMIEKISRLHLAAEDSELEALLFESQNSNLQQLSSYFNINEIQCLLLSGFIYLCQNNNSVDINELANHYNYPKLNMMKFANDFRVLESKYFIKRNQRLDMSPLLTGRTSFVVNEKLLYLVFNELPINELEPKVIFGHEIEVLELLNHYTENPDEAPVFFTQIPVWYRSLIANNTKFKLFAWLNELAISNVELIMLSLIIWDKVNDTNFRSLDKVKDFFEVKADWWRFRETINSGTNALITLQIVHKDNNGFGEYFTLSPNTESMLMEMGILASLFSLVKKHESNELFLEDISEIFSNRGNNRGDHGVLISLLHKTIEMNCHLPLVKKIKSHHIKIENEIVLYLLAWNSLLGNDLFSVKTFVEVYFKDIVERISYISEIHGAQNELIQADYILITEGGFFSNAHFQLKPDGKLLFREAGLNILNVKINRENLITPEKLTTKNLFYPAPLSKQISLVAESLLDKNLNSIRESLQEKGMNKGLNVLLHGAAGTGKTETVYQLAKSSMRNIMKVDISNTKSMWFGESEKKIKNIFREYNQLVGESERIPILLFNEADAVISKRIQNITSITGKVENSMQNILLEELENFDGILFATTNLIANIDSAFDRRFLFKIEFLEPDFEAKIKIWQSKLPKLKLENLKFLAENYNFTGGQIDNVVRKIEIQAILDSKALELECIINFCNQEIFSRNKSKQSIGFKVG